MNNVIFKCRHCGSDIARDTVFCANCGKNVREEPANQSFDRMTVRTNNPPPPNNYYSNETPRDSYIPASQPPVKNNQAGPLDLLKKHLKLVIAAAAALVVLVIAIVVIATVASGSKYLEVKASLFIDQFDDVIHIRTGSVKAKIDGTTSGSKTSMDGTKAVITVKGDGGDELWYFDGKKATKIDDAIYSFKFAASGNGIAYTKEMDIEEGTVELWLFTGSGKGQKITAALKLSGGKYCISPNGKTVGYTAEKKENSYGCFWDGKEKEIGKNKTPVAIADGGKFVYYEDSNGSLFVQKGVKDDNKNKLASGDNGYSGLRFNKDLSQVVLNSDGKCYISRNGGEKKQIASHEISSFITPADTQSSGNIYGIGSFANTFYNANSNKSVMYINNKFESNSVVKNADMSYLASDGSTLLYLKNDKVYKVNGRASNASESAVELVKKSDDDISGFGMIKNGSAIYFVNTDGVLYYQKGTGKPVKVTDDFDGGDYFNKANKLFYIYEDELYVSSGGKGKKVPSIEGDVNGVTATAHYVLVTASDGNETYYYISANGAKFELIGTK